MSSNQNALSSLTRGSTLQLYADPHYRHHLQHTVSKHRYYQRRSSGDCAPNEFAHSVPVHQSFSRSVRRAIVRIVTTPENSIPSTVDITFSCALSTSLTPRTPVFKNAHPPPQRIDSGSPSSSLPVNMLQFFWSSLSLISSQSQLSVGLSTFFSNAYSLQLFEAAADPLKSVSVMGAGPTTPGIHHIVKGIRLQVEVPIQGVKDLTMINCQLYSVSPPSLPPGALEGKATITTAEATCYHCDIDLQLLDKGMNMPVQHLLRIQLREERRPCEIDINLKNGRRILNVIVDDTGDRRNKPASESLDDNMSLDDDEAELCAEALMCSDDEDEFKGKELRCEDMAARRNAWAEADEETASTTAITMTYSVWSNLITYPPVLDFPPNKLEKEETDKISNAAETRGPEPRSRLTHKHISLAWSILESLSTMSSVFISKKRIIYCTQQHLLQKRLFSSQIPQCLNTSGDNDASPSRLTTTTTFQNIPSISIGGIQYGGSGTAQHFSHWNRHYYQQLSYSVKEITRQRASLAFSFATEGKDHGMSTSRFASAILDPSDNSSSALRLHFLMLGPMRTHVKLHIAQGVRVGLPKTAMVVSHWLGGRQMRPYLQQPHSEIELQLGGSCINSAMIAQEQDSRISKGCGMVVKPNRLVRIHSTYKVLPSSNTAKEPCINYSHLNWNVSSDAAASKICLRAPSENELHHRISVFHPLYNPNQPFPALLQCRGSEIETIDRMRQQSPGGQSYKEFNYVEESASLFSTQSQPSRHHARSVWHHTSHACFQSDAVAKRILDQSPSPSASRSIYPQNYDEVGVLSFFPMVCPLPGIAEEDVVLGLKVQEMCLKWLSSPAFPIAKISQQRWSGIPEDEGGLLMTKTSLRSRGRSLHYSSSSAPMWLQSTLDPSLIRSATVANKRIPASTGMALYDSAGNIRENDAGTNVIRRLVNVCRKVNYTDRTIKATAITPAINLTVTRAAAAASRLRKLSNALCQKRNQSSALPMLLKTSPGNIGDESASSLRESYAEKALLASSCKTTDDKRLPVPEQLLTTQDNKVNISITEKDNPECQFHSIRTSNNCFEGHIWLYIPSIHLDISSSSSMFGITLPSVGTIGSPCTCKRISQSSTCSPRQNGSHADINNKAAEVPNIAPTKATGRYIRCWVTINRQGDFHWIGDEPMDMFPTDGDRACGQNADSGSINISTFGLQLISTSIPTPQQLPSVMRPQSSSIVSQNPRKDIQVSMTHKLRLYFFSLKISVESSETTKYDGFSNSKRNDHLQSRSGITPLNDQLNPVWPSMYPLRQRPFSMSSSEEITKRNNDTDSFEKVRNPSQIIPTANLEATALAPISAIDTAATTPAKARSASLCGEPLKAWSTLQSYARHASMMISCNPRRSRNYLDNICHSHHSHHSHQSPLLGHADSTAGAASKYQKLSLFAENNVQTALYRTRSAPTTAKIFSSDLLSSSLSTRSFLGGETDKGCSSKAGSLVRFDSLFAATNANLTSTTSDSSRIHGQSQYLRSSIQLNGLKNNSQVLHAAKILQNVAATALKSPGTTTSMGGGKSRTQSLSSPKSPLPSTVEVGVVATSMTIASSINTAMPSTTAKFEETRSKGILPSTRPSLQDIDGVDGKEVDGQKRTSGFQESAPQRQAINRGRALAEVDLLSSLTPSSPPPLSRRCERLFPKEMATERFAPATVTTVNLPNTMRSPQRESKVARPGLDQILEKENQQARADEECWPFKIVESRVREQCPFLNVELVPTSDENYHAPKVFLTLRGYTETEDEWIKLKSALEKFLDSSIKDCRDALPPKNTLIPSYHAPARASREASNTMGSSIDSV